MFKLNTLVVSLPLFINQLMFDPLAQDFDLWSTSSQAGIKWLTDYVNKGGYPKYYVLRTHLDQNSDFPSNEFKTIIYF